MRDNPLILAHWTVLFRRLVRSHRTGDQVGSEVAGGAPFRLRPPAQFLFDLFGHVNRDRPSA